MTVGKLLLKRKLFVVMPFGVRDAPPAHSNESIDFDDVYFRLIRPAAVAAGWDVVRIDEVVRPGPISDHYLEEIYSADLVLADVSVANANVFYELGIRHAISTGGTLLIALKGTQLPFDVAHLRVIFYEIDPQAIEVAWTSLVRVLTEYDPSQTLTSNPIRAFLEKVGATSSPSSSNAAFEHELHGRVSRARNVDQLIAVWRWAQNLSPLPAFPLLSLADRLADYEAWQTSVEVLNAASAARPDDFEIHRQLGWHLRHLGRQFEPDAVSALEKALELNPGDPESIGMLAGIFKRMNDYRRAAELYDRGARLSPDSLYMRVNQAAMAVMTNPSDPAHGLSLYVTLYADISGDSQRQSDAWAQLVLGEAAFAIGEFDRAQQHFRRAFSLTHSLKDLRSAADQLEILATVGFRVKDARRLTALIRRFAAPELTVQEISPKEDDAAPTDTPVIIHLSDIHFGARDVNGKQTVMRRFFDGDYEKTLSAHVAAEFASRYRHFQYNSERFYLVISGDLTYTAEKKEFEQVRESLDEIASALGITKERVVLVPGNHDVHWSSTRIDMSHRFDNYLAFLQHFYGEELFRRRYPRITWDFHINSDRPLPNEIVSVCHEAGFSVLGLNSCVYESDQDHYGFVGGRQLDTLAQVLDECGGSTKDLRIAVLHHHLHPYPEPIKMTKEDQVWMDLSTIRDAGLVERRLGRLGFDIVLRGHKHKPQLRETLIRDREEARSASPRLIVCGAGSAGVNGKELEHNCSNHYEIVEILQRPRVSGADFLAIEWRELALQPSAEWVTTGRWTVMG